MIHSDRKQIDFNKVYHSNNYGDFIILKEVDPVNSKRMILVKFLNSDELNPEHIGVYELSTALKGEIKDPYLKNICGVACIGNAKSTINGSIDKRYRVWSDMISRCYNVNYTPYKSHGACGVTVCLQWHCYEYFLCDVVNLPGYQEWINCSQGEYELDKDILQQNIPINMRVYSPTTCMFVPSYKNAQTIRRDNEVSKYVGVQAGGSVGKFRVKIGPKESRLSIGTFDDEIAAANAYNAYAEYFNDELGYDKYMINDVPYMTPMEIKSHTNSKIYPGIPMYRIIDHNK